MKKSLQSALLGDFAWRGLIADVTSQHQLDAHLGEAPRSIYCGFDPTADSLHVGSLLPLLALRRIQLAGHRPIVLIGGGTGLIGDPSGKAGERQLNPAEQVAEWADRLRKQVERFFDFGGAQPAILANNYEWLSRLEVIPFLRDVGKHFSVGSMIAREAVRARMGAGISYTEFSYQVLQAYDFLELHRRHGCTMQIGGSDQWGNITAGTDLIRRIDNATAFGLTLPLVTKTDGSKFGKTESGTVWLDPRKTSPYEMYQFWLNTADADAGAFLKYFTFLERERIEALEAGVRHHPEQREAQRVLAREVTTLVHGETATQEAETITRAFFSGDLGALTEGQLAQACQGMPRTELTDGDLGALSLVELLTRVGLAESKKRGRELVAAGAIHVNGQPARNADARVSRDLARYGRFIILRKGKKTYHLALLA
ncbi:MAG: tyrosine--tRNA ligase [Candidatus Rokubacteria bacterium]|nr:tyrosine--tRNA ligase [Candidatus Rokubacteria bacterium]